MPAIPENLMARLHQANEHFHQARLRLDAVDQMNQDQKRDVAAALRAAEKELEDVTREVSSLLSPDTKPSADARPGRQAPGT
jgi:exonuclease VII small subunit